eukprot:Gb_38166 [translate_table: standard]
MPLGSLLADWLRLFPFEVSGHHPVCWRPTNKPRVGMARHSIHFEGPIEEFEKILDKGTTSVHVTALDGLVNVNSLFTVAVFVGLSLATPGQRSLEDKGACDAGEDVAKNLLVFEVVAFSSFLFSSLIAQGLKLAIILNNSKQVTEAFKAYINNKLLRLGMLASAFGKRPDPLLSEGYPLPTSLRKIHCENFFYLKKFSARRASLNAVLHFQINSRLPLSRISYTAL